MGGGLVTLTLLWWHFLIYSGCRATTLWVCAQQTTNITIRLHLLWSHHVYVIIGIYFIFNLSRSIVASAQSKIHHNKNKPLSWQETCRRVLCVRPDYIPVWCGHYLFSCMVWYIATYFIEKINVLKESDIKGEWRESGKEWERWRDRKCWWSVTRISLDTGRPTADDGLTPAQCLQRCPSIEPMLLQLCGRRSLGDSDVAGTSWTQSIIACINDTSQRQSTWPVCVPSNSSNQRKPWPGHL